MADKRKLQGEVDRCQKKIQEGLEAFDDIWKKVHGTNNSNQKEKFEADLKKEIKKLQRLRDQIKTWVVSGDVKDKDSLIDYRRKIEGKMEQFKVIERETKTKAYSKEGLLGATGKVDPKEKEKEDLTNWLQHCIQELGVLSDGIEGSIEQLTGRRKKLAGDDQAKCDQFKDRLQRNKYHVGKLETILRLVDNGAPIVDQVNSIKDNVEYYISSHDDDSNEVDDSFYDDLDLDEITALQTDLASSPPDLEAEHLGSSHSSVTTNHSSESPSPVTTTAPHSKSGVKNNLVLKIGTVPTTTTSSCTSSTTPKVPPTPTKLTTPNTPSTPSSEVSSSSGSGRPSLATSCGLGYAQVAGSHASSSGSSVNGLVSVTSSVAPSPSVQPVASIVSSRPTTQSSPAPALSAIVTASSLPNPTAAPQLNSIAQQQQQLPSLSSNQVQQLVQQQQLLQQKQQNLSTVVNGTANVSEISQGGETLASLSLKTLVHNAAAAAAGLGLESQTNGDLKNIPASIVTSLSDQGPALMSSSGDATVQSLVAASNGDQQQKLLQQQQQLLQQQQAVLQQQQQSSSTQMIHLTPLLSVAPLGPQPTSQDHTLSQKVLESAFMRVPYPCDSERIRLYFPNNPCPTPQWYPQATPPHLNSFDFFSRLDTDSLFFLFYYMEGTKAQYFAAKALKQKSWRFHTKYMMWFQRHEEPKTITEEYEQGTYIYFDYEKWGQRKKEGFRFEYKFLEDQEL